MAERLQIIISAKDQFSGAFKKLGVHLPQIKQLAAAASVAVVGMGAAFYKVAESAVQAASDFEETNSKFQTVFNDQIGIAEKWADELNSAYILSREESRRYLSSVQDLLVPMGMASDAAGEMSFEIVKLAADLGSFNNLPTEQVIGDIQSALVGNYETMKKYGAVVTATTVQQRALEMGLAETKEELTAGQKAQAAYALILESSKAAIGDVARTSNSWANQVRQLHANINDLQVTIGNYLLPQITPLLQQLNEWIKLNGQMLAQDVGTWMREVAEMIIAVAKALKWVDDNLTDRVLDFFTGSTEQKNKLQILQDQLKRYRQDLQDLYTEYAEGGDVTEADIKRKSDLIKITEQEIEALKQTKTAQQEVNEILLKHAEILNIPLPPNPMVAALEGGSGGGGANILDRIREYNNDLKAENEDFYNFLAGLDDDYNQRQKEQWEEKLQYLRELQLEYSGTELERLDEWYAQLQEQYMGHQESLAIIDEIYSERRAEIENKLQQKKHALQQKAFNDTLNAMRAFGQKGFVIAKAYEIAQATMAAYRSFTNTMATASEYFLPPVPQIMAAAALAAGLARVAAIAATEYGGAAHGGLTDVPREQTYLLEKGERVLSPKQNEDLTRFLESGGSGATVNLTVNTQQPLDKVNWDDLVEDEVLPALTRLHKAGIKI